MIGRLAAFVQDAFGDDGSQKFGFACLAFPNHDDAPTGVLQFGGHHSVSMLVGGEFPKPEFGSRLWIGCLSASGVPMPKAAVYEDHEASAWKNEVRLSWQVLPVQPEP